MAVRLLAARPMGRKRGHFHTSFLPPTTMRKRDRLKENMTGPKEKRKTPCAVLPIPGTIPKAFPPQAFFPTPTKKMTLLNVFCLLVLVPRPTAAAVAPEKNKS